MNMIFYPQSKHFSIHDRKRNLRCRKFSRFWIYVLYCCGFVRFTVISKLLGLIIRPARPTERCSVISHHSLIPCLCHVILLLMFRFCTFKTRMKIKLGSQSNIIPKLLPKRGRSSPNNKTAAVKVTVTSLRRIIYSTLALELKLTTSTERDVIQNYWRNSVFYTDVQCLLEAYYHPQRVLQRRLPI